MARDRADEGVAIQPRKKSFAIRPLHVVGILLLGLVIALEATSSRFYASTVEGVENAMREARFVRNEVGLSGAEVAKQIRGIPFVTDEIISVPGQPTRSRKFYYWPGLAGNYRLAITFDDQNRAITLINDFRPNEEVATSPEAVADKSTPTAPSPNKKQDKPATRTLPKEGIASIPANTLALDTIEPSIVSTMMKRRCGTIYREIFRQMVLVAARDELGLNTLDASLGEVPFVKDGSQAFALQVDLKLAGNPKTPKEAKLIIELQRPDAAGQWFTWSSTPIAVSGNPGLDELLVLFEPLSRGELIEGLKQAGFEPSTETVDTPEELPKSIANRLDFVAEFAELRYLHALRRANGETLENLGALVRAYANLGNLIDFHWSPMSKTFKARSLVYAQRMIAKYGTTPETLAHRAYAWALAGNHLLSLRDIEAVQQMPQDGVPAWLTLIHAYCVYEPEKLKGVDASQRELGSYLLMRMISPAYETDLAVPVIQEVHKRNPACTRVMMQMRRTNTLGLVRTAGERLGDTCWQEIARRMKEIPGLPDEIKKMVRSRSGVTIFNMFSRAGARQQPEIPRSQIIQKLRSAGESLTDHQELSWTVLSEMLHDFAFFEAHQEVTSLAQWLGLSPEAIDETITRYASIIESHRFGKYLRFFGSDRPAKIAGLKEIYNSVKTTEYEIQAAELARAAYQADPDMYRHMSSYIDNHWDKLYDELLEATMAAYPTWTNDAWNEIIKISPHYPLAIARRFHTDPSFNREKGLELEKRFADNRYLLGELGQKYRSLGMRSDAVRCMATSYKIAPTYNTAFELADLYDGNEQPDLAQEVLTKAMELESHGLENGNAHRKLAQILMRQGKWNEAGPHAHAAGETYSASGLLCAARCSEGMEEWKLAEQYIRAMSERYDNSADEWYFWCIRTGAGDVEHARPLAEKYWATFVPPLENHQIWTTAIRQIVDGDPKAAIETFTNPQSIHHHNGTHFLMAGLLSDQLGDTARRDHYFEQVENRFTKDFLRVQLVNLFRRALDDEKEFRWSRKSFEEFVDELTGDEVATMYYCAGEFLRLHGQEELSTEYLRIAATTFNVSRYVCTLANFNLRSRGIDAGLSRLNWHPDDRTAFIKHFWRSNRYWTDSKPGEARAEINAALAMNPEFVRGFICRARMNEKEDRTADAIADYSAALALNPDSEMAHAGLAVIYACCPTRNFATRRKRSNMRNEVWISVTSRSSPSMCGWPPHLLSRVTSNERLSSRNLHSSPIPRIPTC